MKSKCLGRCRAGHVTVLEYDANTIPEGVCKHQHQLVEFAVKKPD
jgi:hypothetical protein